MSTPVARVSVITTTYNHEAYIAATLDSVLAQETSFAVELLVGDDASSDSTPEVVAVYASRHPQRVRATLRSTNLGRRANFTGLLSAARGDYLAFCEGDDLWTSPDKLQRQVELLDRDPQAVACCHDVVFHYADEREDEVRPGLGGTSLGFEDLVHENLVPTCSLMLRRSAVGRLPAWYAEVVMGDWPLVLLATEHGVVRHIDATMALYRIHPAGVWSRLGFNDRLLAEIECLEQVGGEVDRQRRRLVAAEIRRRAIRATHRAIDCDRPADARRWLGRALAGRGRLPVPASLEELKLVLRVLSPRTFARLHGLADALRRRRPGV